MQPPPDAVAMPAPRQAKRVDVLDQLFAHWETALSLDG
jgi:hypothetical protein